MCEIASVVTIQRQHQIPQALANCRTCRRVRCACRRNHNCDSYACHGRLARINRHPKQFWFIFRRGYPTRASNLMINARAETMLEKPSFKQLVSRRRCLVPADGFYEWRREGKRKVPMWIHLKNCEPFAFAGLWDYWRDPAGDKELYSSRSLRLNRMPYCGPSSTGCQLSATTRWANSGLSIALAAGR
jgi:SOS response associated peptidase (SRAP)